MSSKEFLREAFDKALVKVLDGIGLELLQDAYAKTPPISDLRYSAFTEYGNPPIQGEVIDSTAIVIDEAKALPETKEGE